MCYGGGCYNANGFLHISYSSMEWIGKRMLSLGAALYLWICMRICIRRRRKYSACSILWNHSEIGALSSSCVIKCKSSVYYLAEYTTVGNSFYFHDQSTCNKFNVTRSESLFLIDWADIARCRKCETISSRMIAMFNVPFSALIVIHLT